jgi:hypothetical protein
MEILSFLTKNKIMGALLLCLIASGCIKPHSQSPNSDESLATFTLKEVGAVLAPGKIDPNFNIVTSTILNYTLCLQDKRTLEPVIGHSFKIEGPEILKDLTSNSSGCLVWTEERAYNFFAQSLYVAQERTVTATGVHSGTRTLKFALNPWRQELFIIDLKYHPDSLSERDLIASNKAEDALMSSTKLPVWADDFTIQTTDVGTSTQHRQIQVRGELTPKVYISNVAGAYSPYTFLKGLFQLHMYFVAETKDGKKFIVLEVKPSENIRMENSKLKFSSLVDAPRSFQQGELKLAFQLIPINAPASLTEYDGIYTLGESDKIAGSFAPKLIKDLNNVNSDYSIAKYLENAFTSSGQKMKLDSEKNQMSLVDASAEEMKALNLVSTTSFIISKNRDGLKVQADAKFQHADKQNFDRDLKFTACILKADGTPLMGKTFQVMSFTGVQLPAMKTTNENKGCIDWTERFKDLNFYNFEIPKAGAITVISDDGDSLKMNIAVDPLNSEKPLLDLRVPSERQEYETIIKNSAQFKMNLALNDVSIIPKADALYLIDKTLNLDTTQAFSLDLKGVKVQRNDRGDDTQFEALKDGYYLIRVALQKDYIDYLDLNTCQKPHYDHDHKMDGCERQHISTTQKVVEFEGGHVKNGTYINLFFSDWRFRKTINNILFEFYPLDVKKLRVKDPAQQVADFNIRFSGPAKSPEAIELFNSLIDKNSNLYSKDNFIGQIVPMDNGDVKLEVNSDERILQICEAKHCPTSFEANIEYDSNDTDPQVSKFKQGNYHLHGVKVQDLMNQERVQIAALNVQKNQQYDFLGFARSTMSDLILLDTKNLTASGEVNFNKVLLPPKVNASNSQAFLNALNSFTPDYDKAQYACPVKSLRENGLTSWVACLAEHQIQPPKWMLGRHFYDGIMVQDKAPEFASNYMPKFNLDSLKQLLNFTAPAKNSENANQLKRNFAYRLCHFWFNDFIPQQKKSFKGTYQSANYMTEKFKLAQKFAENVRTFSNQKQRADELTDSCVEEVYIKGPDAVFFMEKKLQVYNFEQNEDTQPVEYFAINIGSSESVGLAISKSLSDNSSVSFNPVAFIGLFLKTNILMSLFTTVGMNFAQSDSISNASSQSHGADTSTAVGLDVEQANMRIRLLEYDPCLNVRLAPRFVESQKLYEKVGPMPTPEQINLRNEKMALIGRGLLLCNGEKIKLPISYTEKYFFISQSIRDPIVTRKYDFRANHYSFKLRGDNELRTFYSLASPQGNQLASDQLNKDHNTRMNVEERLKNINDDDPSIPYRQPSYPSVITIH